MLRISILLSGNIKQHIAIVLHVLWFLFGGGFSCSGLPYFIVAFPVLSIYYYCHFLKEPYEHYTKRIKLPVFINF